ncbi:MAG: cation:proton antiporter [Opitutae bacterium]|nr:cation:proton antiporter [Opitutae bacterium]
MHGIDFIQDLAVVMLVAGLVGWLCHRAGLSAVVGYLVAGMIIGPYTPPFSLVTNIGRIETLAQLGLVFLMFSIGMKLSLRRLRRLGGSLVVAVIVGAVIMYNLAHVVGAALGWGSVHTVFLAGMLMVSSSAIISKVLQDLGATHEKTGQMAMGVSVLEDIVAIVMLTILNSLTRVSGPGEASLGATLGLVSAFVVLAGVAGLLVVPWLMRRLSITADNELLVIVVAGLLFMLAILAQKAGFSLALGAFLLGAIVADTPHRGQVDRMFEGTRDMFSAVFFVAIGMMINFHAVAHLWWLVLLLTAVVLVGRSFALATGFVVAGVATREAVTVGLSVTPLGEFSFIIAQAGVLAGVLPPEFQAVVVGVALLTTLSAPALMRRAPAIGGWVDRHLPGGLDKGLAHYRRWLGRLEVRQQHSVLWQLCRKRLGSILVEVLFVSGVLVFAEQLFAAVGRFLPGEGLFPNAQRVVFWGGLTGVTLLPLVAIWRHVSVLAMIFAEMSTAGQADDAKLRPRVATGIRVVAGVLLFVWLSALAPVDRLGRWLPLAGALVLAGAVTLLRRKLVYWHSVVETELQERLVPGEKKFSGTAAPWLRPHEEWRLALTECVLPDLADSRGRTLGELALRTKFGCIVVGIERHGVTVPSPGRETVLYPHDRVLLLGDGAQAAAGKAFLTHVSGAAPAVSFDEVRMESVPLPAGCPLAGRSLAELAPNTRCGVIVVGLRRGVARTLNPRGGEKLAAGDDVLVLGNPEQIAAFKAWVQEV